MGLCFVTMLELYVGPNLSFCSLRQWALARQHVVGERLKFKRPEQLSIHAAHCWKSVSLVKRGLGTDRAPDRGIKPSDPLPTPCYTPTLLRYIPKFVNLNKSIPPSVSFHDIHVMTTPDSVTINTKVIATCRVKWVYSSGSTWSNPVLPAHVT